MGPHSRPLPLVNTINHNLTLGKTVKSLLQQKYHDTSGRGRLLGPALGLEKTLYTEIKLKTKIKDDHNSTKIGASNIFGGNHLRFRISAH